MMEVNGAVLCATCGNIKKMRGVGMLAWKREPVL